jgi:hypothetical protein
MEYDLTYHNTGPVVVDSNYDPVSLVHVYLGQFSASTTALMDYFASHIGDTPWYEVLTTYYQEGSAGIQFVMPGTLYSGNASFPDYPAGAAVTDGDIQQLLAAAVRNPDLAATYYTYPTAVFMVMFRGDLNVSFHGKLWLKDWCSYHGAFYAEPSGVIVKYSVVGDPSTAPGDSGAVCEPVRDRPTANRDLGADSMATGYAQQLAQTITDFNSFTWFADWDGAEVGSACQGDFGGGLDLRRDSSNLAVGDKRFLVQSLWQRSVGCTMNKV